MLDPRLLTDRREEIADSCQKRGVEVDLDAAVAARDQVAKLQTEVQELNRVRNEHQKAGKRPLSTEDREAHGSEGRRLKEAVAAVEGRLGEARAELDGRLSAIPNLMHPDVPVGGE